MLKVYRDSINDIYVTFTELMTVKDNWIYLKLINETQTDQEYFTILKSNLSQNSRLDRYQLTEVAAGVIPNPAAGEISLQVPGYYMYFAYEIAKDQIIREPYDIELIKKLEIGRCFVVGSDNTYQDPTTVLDSSVYE